ncbi:helix-turn-helix domain-containing protein [Mucilaginibacter robiniae]|uniref:Helix-turn-helix domain-containing protein n=1 Tax=Mucilaginibacter robiniae TaxID=2728022 RepID=A0A7L5DWW2_9SPHI|nr:helix-turn-helix domain-containing protein [Mucilaginibacter robiniae]QJD94738.1 helix-turn-helix domain-containing protein [Mucilaginibacter robiniae]
MSEKQFDIFFKTIEVNIRQQTKVKRITLADLAQLIDMTEAGFYKMLSSESIKVKTLKKVAEVLQQPVEFFLKEQPQTEKAQSQYIMPPHEAYLAEPPSVYQKENESLQKQIRLLEDQLKDKEKIIQLLSYRT